MLYNTVLHLQGFSRLEPGTAESGLVYCFLDFDWVWLGLMWLVFGLFVCLFVCLFACLFACVVGSFVWLMCSFGGWFVGWLNA